MSGVYFGTEFNVVVDHQAQYGPLNTTNSLTSLSRAGTTIANTVHVIQFIKETHVDYSEGPTSIKTVAV